MIRFEELQMKIAESAKKFLDFQNMQVFIEQYSLERETRLFFSLPDRDFSHLYQSTASFTYDISQTEISLYEEEFLETDSLYQSTTELTFTIDFPSLRGYPDIDGLIREIEDEYPDIEPILVIKKVFSPLNVLYEYELIYTYEIDIEGELDLDYIDDIFKEHRDILNFIYDKTFGYLDLSWYGEVDE
ncbi:MAG: hypothetical protein N2511_07435 [Thermodesulfovibrionales bacterium]|nr:hypothetical protein [Thermodesulfovibrionales bacterium]